MTSRSSRCSSGTQWTTDAGRRPGGGLRGIVPAPQPHRRRHGSGVIELVLAPSVASTLWKRLPAPYEHNVQQNCADRTADAELDRQPRDRRGPRPGAALDRVRQHRASIGGAGHRASHGPRVMAAASKLAPRARPARGRRARPSPAPYPSARLAAAPPGRAEATSDPSPSRSPARGRSRALAAARPLLRTRRRLRAAATATAAAARRRRQAAQRELLVQAEVRRDLAHVACAWSPRTNVTLMPERPARPVRPVRWT